MIAETSNTNEKTISNSLETNQLNLLYILLATNWVNPTNGDDRTIK